jgi:hypothetical protein
MVNKRPVSKGKSDGWDLYPVGWYLEGYMAESYTRVIPGEALAWESEGSVVLEREWPWHGYAVLPSGQSVPLSGLCGPVREISRARALSEIFKEELFVSVVGVEVNHPVWGSGRVVDAAVAAVLLAGGAGVSGAWVRVPESLVTGRGDGEWHGGGIAAALGLELVEGVFCGRGSSEMIPRMLSEMTRAL